MGKKIYSQEKLQNLSTDVFPWLMNDLKKDEVIHVNDVATLPDEALKEKNLLYQNQWLLK